METLIITVVGGLIVGLILRFVLGIDKPKIQSSKRKRVGIMNRGKHNQFYNNTFSGLDVGINDQGEDTKASGNKFS